MMRCVLENPSIFGEYLKSGLGLYYIGNMYRRENPQRGRLREFRQLGVENLGVKTPLIDAELILIAYSFLKELGIDEKQFTLEINTLGELEDRNIYIRDLKEFLMGRFSELSFDSQARLESGGNILRILDSKSDKDASVCLNAPVLTDYLREDSLEYYNQVLQRKFIILLLSTRSIWNYLQGEPSSRQRFRLLCEYNI